MSEAAQRREKPMKRVEKARPFVPTEIHVATVTDEKGSLGILSIRTTEGLLDIALDRQAADTIMKAIAQIRAKLEPIES
ncbi:hypothetical protein MesoLj131b_76820 (plasmid) [Mesorhizobium sp. 131-2-5]|nr:hypothetical protein MesoLj131b_76820 [Mesorhizobium sp. 131-2-5]